MASDQQTWDLQVTVLLLGGAGYGQSAHTFHVRLRGDVSNSPVLWVVGSRASTAIEIGDAVFGQTVRSRECMGNVEVDVASNAKFSAACGTTNRAF